jgi:lipopolysaccharide/colanic/teichoic acid biosynthesis glycosyltransferase
MLITAILARIKLGSTVLFTQDRPRKINLVTGREKIFKPYKFRTMTDEWDENGEFLPDEVGLTKFGCTLQTTSLE